MLNVVNLTLDHPQFHRVALVLTHLFKDTGVLLGSQCDLHKWDEDDGREKSSGAKATQFHGRNRDNRLEPLGF